MSYRVTEAGRNHVAAIEETQLYFERKLDKAGVPETIIHLTDNDKMDLSALLPKYKFVWDKDSDENSKLKLLDEASGFEISCEGLKDEAGNALGIGWRYTLRFNKDDNDYVNSISIVRENDNKTIKTLSFSKMSDLTIKNLVVGKQNGEDGNLTVNGETVLKGNVTAEADLDLNGVAITDDKVEITKELVQKENATFEKDVTVVETANLKNVNITGGQVNVSDTTVILDESATLDAAHASISDLSNKTLNVTEKADIKDLEAATAEVTDLTALNAEITNVSSTTIESETADINTLNATDATIKQATLENVNVTEKINTKNLEVVTSSVDVEYVKNANIGSENVRTSTINQASIDVENVKDLTVASEKVSVSDIARLKSTKASVTNLDSNNAAFDFAEVSSKLKANDIKALDENNIVSVTGNNMSLGDEHNVLVIKSKANNNSNLDIQNRIRVEVGDSVAYIATTEDLALNKVNGVVDLTTAQAIKGKKQFKDFIVADKGLIGPNDIGNGTQNIITRMHDANNAANVEAAYEINPEFTAAEEMYGKYNANLANYKTTISSLSKRNAIYASFADLTSTKETLESQVAAAAKAKDNASATKDSLAQEISNLTAVAKSKEQEKAALADEIESINKETLLNTKDKSIAATAALNEYLTDFNEFTASLTPSNFPLDADDSSLISARDTTKDITVRLQALDLYYNSICEKVSYTNVVNALNDIIKAKNFSYTYRAGQVIVTATDVSGYVNTYSTLKSAADGFSSIDAENLELYNANTAAITSLTEEIAATWASVSVAMSERDTVNLEFEHKLGLYESLSKSLTTTARDLNAITNELKTYHEDSFMPVYEKYLTVAGKNKETVLYSEELSLDDIITPEEATLNYDQDVYDAYRLGLIDQYIIDFEADKIVLVGNDEDELQLRSDALQDGDEHIQATIGGHYHKLANLDDTARADFAEDTNNEVVGELNIDTIENGVEFKSTYDKVVANEDVVNGTANEGLIDGDNVGAVSVEEPKSRTEKIFTIIGSDFIKVIPGEEDNTAILDIDDEVLKNITLATILERVAHSSLSAEENKVTNNNIYKDAEGNTLLSEKSFSIDSRKDLEVTLEDDKNINIELKNIFQRDLDLNNVEHTYVEEYNALQAIDTNKDLLASAIAVKQLYSNNKEFTTEVKHQLDTRVPIAPNATGRYGLVATVHAGPEGHMSSVYSWDGTITGLPDVVNYKYYYINNEGNKIYIQGDVYNEVPAEYQHTVGFDIENDKDWDEDDFIPYTDTNPAEYVLKMRMYKNEDGTMSPVYKWAKLF